MTHSSQIPEPVLSAYLSWWHALHNPKASGAQRAARAQLKRCHNLTAVTLEPAYQQLYQRLRAVHGELDRWPDRQDRLAALVALGAHLKEHDGDAFAVAASKGGDGGKAPLSPLRFRRLLDADDIETLFVGLRRALPLLGYQLDLKQLAKDVFGWSDEVKRRWAYAYTWPADSQS